MKVANFLLNAQTVHTLRINIEVWCFPNESQIFLTGGMKSVGGYSGIWFTATDMWASYNPLRANLF